ncbi:MAG: MogA/MoaB family molybdenum cofactor biosynthesis protein [Acidobacteria bacterium]|jgi:molybdenum cofactor biosynthesis protein B|nr:MogA/MoaB family molybdenum cofactor biosynthesis protein [Acidobacteriota bacterium]
MSAKDHRAAAPATVVCAVVTVSDTRTEATDRSGDAIAARLEAAGHRVEIRHLVKDDPEAIRLLLESHLASGGVDAIITTGGTGITSRDGTYEVVSGLIERPLPGFGELFRMLSFEQVGAAAMLSRACAGVAGRLVVFALPGSEAAVTLAMDRLIVPELSHVIRELRR